MSWGTIVGGVVGIGGIWATLLVFAIGECNQLLSTKSRLEGTAASNSREIRKLETQGKSLEKRLRNLEDTLRDNSKFTHDSAIYEEMNGIIAMAESALEEIGGSDVRLSVSDLSDWRTVLEHAGFEPKKPVTNIIIELSDSSSTQVMPVESLLARPADAAQFVAEMRNWQAEADARAARLFEHLLYEFGPQHHTAGPQLEKFLQSEISDTQDQRNILLQQVLVLRAEYATTTILHQNVHFPVYCF